MEAHDNTRATLCGLIYAALLSNIPSEWLSYGEKLLYGAVLAFITGFTYKAGGWLWLRLVKGKNES